jgi:hypothetical protein
VPAPRVRTIAYNATGPISALGFKSTTLAQLMARYATMDPTLISSTSDKRKAPSLVTPPAAKKKRTTKKVPIEVTLLSLDHKVILHLTNLILCIFRPDPSNHQQLQNLPMLHLLV